MCCTAKTICALLWPPMGTPLYFAATHRQRSLLPFDCTVTLNLILTVTLTSWLFLKLSVTLITIHRSAESPDQLQSDTVHDTNSGLDRNQILLDRLRVHGPYHQLTHTHNTFNGSLSRTTWVSRYHIRSLIPSLWLLLVLLRPSTFHRHRGGWLPPSQDRHRSVLQCSRRPFWALFPENCRSVFRRAVCSVSHINAASILFTNTRRIEYILSLIK